MRVVLDERHAEAAAHGAEPGPGVARRSEPDKWRAARRKNSGADKRAPGERTESAGPDTESVPTQIAPGPDTESAGRVPELDTERARAPTESETAPGPSQKALGSDTNDRVPNKQRESAGPDLESAGARHRALRAFAYLGAWWRWGCLFLMPTSLRFARLRMSSACVRVAHMFLHFPGKIVHRRY